MLSYRTIIIKSFITMCLVGIAYPVRSMTLTGPITANNVSVTGAVTLSSMTVSSMTVTNLNNVAGITKGISGRILQMKFSSSTVTTSVSTTSWTPVSNIAKSITLSNANNAVRISLSGMIRNTKIGGLVSGYITVFRDSTNLGDANQGLSAARGSALDNTNSVGITLMDSPGDTSVHTYQAFIKLNFSGGGDTVSYPYGSCTGYLVLEEISQ